MDSAHKVLGQGAFDDIAAGILDRIGQGAGTTQGEFSPASFLTNFVGSNKGMSEEAKTALLSNLRDPIDAANTLGAVERAAMGLQDAGAFYNTSRTAATMEGIDTLKNLARMAIAPSAAFYGAGIPGAAGTVALPWLAAKATTNPTVISTVGGQPWRSFWEYAASPSGPISAGFKTGLMEMPPLLERQ